MPPFLQFDILVLAVTPGRLRPTAPRSLPQRQPFFWLLLFPSSAPIDSSGCSIPESRCDAPNDRSRQPIQLELRQILIQRQTRIEQHRLDPRAQSIRDHRKPRTVKGFAILRPAQKGLSGIHGEGPPKTRASPNFRATAQTGAAIAARYDSFDGDPLETHWAPQKIRRSNCRHTQPEGRVAPRSTTAHSTPLHLTKSPNNPRRTPTRPRSPIADCCPTVANRLDMQSANDTICNAVAFIGRSGLLGASSPTTVDQASVESRACRSWQ